MRFSGMTMNRDRGVFVMPSKFWNILCGSRAGNDAFLIEVVYKGRIPLLII